MQYIMSADLQTGKTPSGHKSSLSFAMAPGVQPLGAPSVSPEAYRKRKVALITGTLSIAAFVQISTRLHVARPLAIGASLRCSSLQVSLDRMDLTLLSSCSRRDTRFTDCTLLPTLRSSARTNATRLPQDPSLLLLQHWTYRAPLQGCTRAYVSCCSFPSSLNFSR